MKDSNKFLVWANHYSYQRQRQLLYNWFGVIVIVIMFIGFSVSNWFDFKMYYVPLPALVIAWFVVFLFRHHFFNAKIIIQQQLKYLLKQKAERGLHDWYKDFVDEEWKDDRECKKAEDYKDITAAIEEVQQRQCLALSK